MLLFQNTRESLLAKGEVARNLIALACTVFLAALAWFVLSEHFSNLLDFLVKRTTAVNIKIYDLPLFIMFAAYICFNSFIVAMFSLTSYIIGRVIILMVLALHNWPLAESKSSESTAVTAPAAST